MKAHERLICRAILDGFVVSVYDGEDWSLIASRNVKEILSEVEAVDDSRIEIYRPPGEKHWARIIMDSGDETVNDYGSCDYFGKISVEEDF